MSSLRERRRKTQKSLYIKIKTFFDILFALTLLIIGFPFFILIALIIKLSSRGPIFFLQKRIGKNNKSFKCIKFRTMHPEAEDIFEKIIKSDKKLREEFEEITN